MDDFVDVIRSGDRREQLEALRDRLADRLEKSGFRDTAPIAKELRSVLEDLENLPDGREESAVDDIASRRAARLADAQGGPVA